MKHLIFIFLLLFTVSVSAQDVFTAFDQFFKNYVDKSGSVDYTSITQEKLTPLSNELAQYSLMDVSPDEEKAFLINAYNFLVITSVVVNGLPASVQDVPGFFTAKTHQVAGQRYSLNGLEKDLLFVKFPDPRLHFVLVCGAISCPPLINKAYRPETLENQLQAQCTSALNKVAFMSFDDAFNTLRWSALFDWYAADFGQKKENIIAWINTYREKAIPADAKTEVMNYDWSLNTQNTFLGKMVTLAIPPSMIR